MKVHIIMKQVPVHRCLQFEIVNKRAYCKCLKIQSVSFKISKSRRTKNALRKVANFAKEGNLIVCSSI